MRFHIRTENGVAMISWYSVSLTISTILMIIKVHRLLYWPRIALTLQRCSPAILLGHIRKIYNRLLTSDVTETAWARISLISHNFLKCLPLSRSLTRWCSPVVKVIRFLTAEHSELCAVLWLMATEIFHTYIWSMHVPAYPMLLYLLESQNILKVCISKTVKLFVLFCKTFSWMFQLQIPSLLEEYFPIFRSHIAPFPHSDLIIPKFNSTYSYIILTQNLILSSNRNIFP